MKSTKLLLLSLVIIFSSITIPSSAETGFFDDFEYNDSIENHDCGISTWGDENAITEVRRSAARNGMGGLYMASTPDGTVRISCRVNIAIDNNTTLSIDVFGVENTGHIQIHIQGEDTGLIIDYGHGGDYWDWHAMDYYSNEIFDTNEWYRMNRTILDDFEAAISHPNSPYDGFTPKYVSSITFIQDGDGNTTYVNYFDNIFVSGKDYSFLDNQTDISDVKDSTTEDTPPSFGIPVFLILIYILVSLFLFSFANYRIDWAKIKNSIKNIFTRQLRTNTIGDAGGTNSEFNKGRTIYCANCGDLNEVRIIYCINCGELNEDSAIYCVNCGDRFPGSTPVRDIDRSQPNSILYRLQKIIFLVVLVLEFLFYFFIMILVGNYLNFFIYLIIITYLLGSIIVFAKEPEWYNISLGKILLLNAAGVIVFYISLAIY